MKTMGRSSQKKEGDYGYIFVSYILPRKIPSHPNPPTVYKRPAVAHHQQRQPDLAPLRRKADAVPPLPVPRPRRRLDQAGGPPQEDLDGGASNTDRGGNSWVANARQDRGERREGEMTMLRSGLVRF